MNAPAANLPDKSARRALWHGYAVALGPSLCANAEEKRERCWLLELRDMAGKLKHTATAETRHLLDPLETLAGWYAFSDEPVERLHALRTSLVSLWVAATQMHAAFPPEIMSDG